MYMSKRIAMAMLTASALAGAATTAVTALADRGGQDRGGSHQGEGNRQVLSTALAPSVTTDPPLLGVAAGGVDWKLRSGRATLHSDGRLDVRIRGLLIPDGPLINTTGPVHTVSVSLYCGASTMPVGTSPTVPLSSEGNARIRTTVMLPVKCQIPALLIHPNGGMMMYIATSGFGG